MKILNETYSKLLHQKVIKAEVAHYGKSTPTKENIKKELAKTANAKEELIMIKQIKTDFGSGSSIVTAYVYDSKEDLKKSEPVTKHMKAQAKKAAEEAAKAAEAPKEEPKAEEKKEEIKEENGG
ncbi:MAG: hypothetical protein KKH88_02610 [Nanoarchaeota archaeon]|nr:hypothetical protein [Nanoarchaeota archaeon]